MLDFLKLWIEDRRLIEKILADPRLTKSFTVSEDGVLLGVEGAYRLWEIRTLSPRRLQITGSLHRYWNCGTNENDFSFPEAVKAIRRFCAELGLPPSAARVVNLEFGLNLQLSLNASTVLDQVVCFRYRAPLRPYQNRPDCYFLEFEQSEYFLKLYDKGKQFRRRLPGTPNTLRLEIKVRSGRYLKALGVETLADLLHSDTLLALAHRLEHTLQGLVLDDDTIEVMNLPPQDRALYVRLSNPRHWMGLKGQTTSTARHQAQRFRHLVERYGARKIYALLTGAVRAKTEALSRCTVGAFRS